MRQGAARKRGNGRKSAGIACGLSAPSRGQKALPARALQENAAPPIRPARAVCHPWGKMTETPHPRPELWTRIALVIGGLRALLLGTVPELFGAVSAHARAQLAAAAALVRRYIHVLAAELVLAPAMPRPATPPKKAPPENPPPAPAREAAFRLTEPETQPSAASAKESVPDTPMLQWALVIAAMRRLSAVMGDPARHARRLAFFLRRQSRQTLREAPVRWSVTRRLPVFTDALLCRLDQAARPAAWAGLDSS